MGLAVNAADTAAVLALSRVTYVLPCRLAADTGTGKTLLAKAAATETGATFIELKVSDVVRGEVGESEKVRES